MPLNTRANNLNQIKKGLVETYKSFLNIAGNDGLNESGEKRWDKICEYVDYDAMWDLIKKPRRDIINLIEKENKRFIQYFLFPTERNFEIPTKLKNHFKTLPLGVYEVSITYNKEGKITNLDEIVKSSQLENTLK